MKNEAIGGIHSVAALLEATDVSSIVELVLDSGRRDKRIRALQTAAQSNNVSIRLVSGTELDRLYPDVRHQGVVAICQPIAVATEAQMFATIAALTKPGLVLVLDGVTDPHNLGAMLRTAEAAGVDYVVCPKDSSVGLTPVVRKVASGAASVVPFCQVTNLARSLAVLKDMGYWLYGAADGADQVYDGPDYTGPVALVLGAEGRGLRRLTREACDVLISIPMAGTVSSLNVSVAAGVGLYEVVRQRRLAAV